MVGHLYATCREMMNIHIHTLFEKISNTRCCYKEHNNELIDKKLSSLIPQKNVRSWMLTIFRFAQCGKAKEVVDLFLEMKNEGLKPNEVFVVVVLATCANLGDLEFGRVQVSFAIKDMRSAKQILSIRIMHDRKEKQLRLLQEHYIKRMFQIFQMEKMSW